MTKTFTKMQGQYLAFIHHYAKINGRPPSEVDIRGYFGTTAPSVHDMAVRLHEKGLISREPGKARTLRVLVLPADLPELV